MADNFRYRPSKFEVLEARQMLTASSGADPANLAAGSPFADSEIIADDFGLDEDFFAAQEALRALDDRISIAQPTGFGDQLRLPVEINGRTQTLVLERALSTRSSSFQVLVQQDDGTLVEFDAGEEANYVGFVEELPGINVRGVFSSRGFSAEAFQANGAFAWSITPDDQLDENGNPIHSVSFTDVFAQLEANHDHDGDGIADHAAGEHVDPEPDGPHGPGCTCEQCSGAATASEEIPQIAALAGIAASANAQGAQSEPSVAAANSVVNAPGNPASRAQVFNQVQVRQAVVGFDVTNEALREGYDPTPDPNNRNNNVLATPAEVAIAVQAVVDNIALFLTTDETVASATGDAISSIYLRDGLVQQVAGKIIIRTSLANDPYAGENGSAAGDADITNGLLLQFGNRWNNNLDRDLTDEQITRRGDVDRDQSDHNFATLLGGSAGTFNGQAVDGLAVVGTVNAGNRYSISDGTSVGGWRGVARHEIGHTLGLPHFGGSGRRAEFDPGGNGIGLFDPMGLRNRLTTDERAVVQAEVNSSNLPLVNAGTSDAGSFTEHNTRPAAERDDIGAVAGAVLIDVLANDFDANNDPIFIDRFESITEAGGTVSFVEGGGDQGQDVLLYTPPTSGFTGEDSFFYFIGDTGGGFTNFGLVTIDVAVTEINLPSGVTSLDLDFGTLNSPVLQNNDFNGIQVTPETNGDIFFTRNGEIIGPDEIGAFDRGPIADINAANQDGFTSEGPVTVNINVDNGVYNVALNLSDPAVPRDNQTVSVNGDLVVADLDNPIGSNATQSFQATVTDGVLSIAFDDLGGVNNEFALNRISLTRIRDLADFDANGFVDGDDLQQFLGDFGLNGDSDANNDGQTNGFDFLVFQRNFAPAQTFTVIDATNSDATVGNNGGLLTTTSAASTGLASTNVNGGAGLVTNNNGRALVDANGAGTFVSIPGWQITRTALNTGNGAFGFDGSPNGAVGDEPFQYAFVNVGEATLASDLILGSFDAGDIFDLSFLGEATNGVGEATATLTFSSGETFTFDTLGVSDTVATFADSYALTGPATSVQVSILLDNTGGGLNQVRVDSISLDVASVDSPFASSTAALESPALEPVTAPGVEQVTASTSGGGEIAQASAVAPVLSLTSAQGSSEGQLVDSSPDFSELSELVLSAPRFVQVLSLSSLSSSADTEDSQQDDEALAASQDAVDSVFVGWDELGSFFDV